MQFLAFGAKCGRPSGGVADPHQQGDQHEVGHQRGAAVGEERDAVGCDGGDAVVLPLPDETALQSATDPQAFERDTAALETAGVATGTAGSVVARVWASSAVKSVFAAAATFSSSCFVLEAPTWGAANPPVAVSLDDEGPAHHRERIGRHVGVDVRAQARQDAVVERHLERRHVQYL